MSLPQKGSSKPAGPQRLSNQRSPLPTPNCVPAPSESTLADVWRKQKEMMDPQENRIGWLSEVVSRNLKCPYLNPNKESSSFLPDAACLVSGRTLRSGAGSPGSHPLGWRLKLRQKEPDANLSRLPKRMWEEGKH